ncbi:MAG TPA: two-component regulator propeller domain-containing protein [Puia sp.]|nr:two-component regulator propeller domain-containing protein [Puia sp.]
MRRLHWLISCLYCWQIVIPAAAQKRVAIPLQAGYVIRNIDNTNGLNSNDVYSLAQDRKGYMWIGTAKGLQRYDGLRFVNCFNTGGIKGDMVVSSIYADDAHSRVLYYQTYNSLCQWSFLNNTASSIAPENVAGPKGGDHYRDWNNNSWTVQAYWADSSQREVGKEGIALVREGGKVHDRWAYFIKDKQEEVTWITDPRYGLSLLDDKSKKVYSIGFNPTGNPLLAGIKLPSSSIRKISTDSHGNIWLISWSHLFYRYHRPTRKLYTYSIAEILKEEGNEGTLPGWVSAVLEDSHGILWLATAKAGLLRYDFGKDEFNYLTCQPGNDLALQYNYSINAIFQDREENIWLGTDKGISIFNPYRQYVSRLSDQHSGPISMEGTEIARVAQAGNKDLWIGSWGGGIKVYDTMLRLKRRFFFKDRYDENMVWSFLQQEDGSTWAGCQHGSLHLIDPVGGAVRTIHPPELQGFTIKCMVKDKEGNTLLGLHNGKIVVWSKEKRCFYAYDTAGQSSSLSLSEIENIYVDNEGHCWAATRNGLGSFDIRKRCFIAVYKPSSLNALHCQGIIDYNDSTLIVGTENNGLYFFNKQAKIFSKIPVNEEQPYWSAHAVAKDAWGNIWFTTDYTICVYNPISGKCFVCQPEKGLIKSAFNSCNFLTAPSGKWIAWTNMEIIEFDPAEILSLQKRTTPITITGFKVFSNSLFIDTLINEKRPVQLSYKENFIGIEFSSLQFSGIEQTKYYYRLEGVDKDWVYGGARGYASYTNLLPGRYTFRVKMENTINDQEMTSMVILIAAPFWATIWFRVLCVAAVVLLIVVLVRWYNRSLRQEARMKQQIAKTEMMALRAQMNPHFIFNCINGIDALIQSDDKYHATIYLNKFARLIRNILDSSKQHTITLARDLETLQLYIDLEQFRNENKFTAEIKVDETLLEEDCKVPPLIVQPYVENAILHGLRNRKDYNGRLTIDISRKNEYLVYRIEDNGVGRAAARSRGEHHSYGMEMSLDRVNFFNREENIPVIITDLQQDGQPAGTRVQISLKIL